MKKIGILLAFLLLIPASFAEIAILPQQPSYNLGNKLKVSASSLNDDFEGLFRLTLACDNFTQQYFTTPISLKSGFRTALDVPGKTILPSMLGACRLTASLLRDDGALLEEKTSSSFFVTTELKILPTDDYVASLPGRSISLVGIVNEAFGNNVMDAPITATVDNLTKESNVAEGRYEISLLLPPNIRSGKHTIELAVQDTKKNSGNIALNLNVIPVPSSISVISTNTSILPGDSIGITASLYDQANELINETLSLSASSGSGDAIFSKNVMSGDQINYEFGQHLKPGNYILKGDYKDLSSEASLEIREIREVRLKYQDQNVIVENIGNVPFVEEFTFLLQDGAKKFPIIKKLSIEPGKILNVDLSKEVPKGIYDIITPVKQGISTLKDELQYVFGANGETNSIKVVADKVEIEDNRPIYRKISSGLSSLTGNVVGADGVFTRYRWIAPFTVIALLGLLIFKYARKPIINMFKSRKDQEEEIRQQQTSQNKENIYK